ncbi:MAG: hypothetical protein ACREVN_08725 [Gammaproteobacteria bacterium]
MSSLSEPRRRRPSRLHALHRWIGATLSLVAIWLALSGILLNRAHDWGLDRRWVRQDWLLDAYGIVPSPPRSAFPTDDGRWISQVGRTVFVDAKPLAEFVPGLSGALRWQEQWILSSGDLLRIVADDGTTVETLYRFDLPGKLIGLAGAGEALRVQTPAGWFEADAELLQWRAVEVNAPAAPPQAPPKAVAVQVGAEARRRVLTWERVAADLHAGRFLAGAGPYVLDAAGGLLCILGISGLVMFTRTLRRRRARRG